MSNENEVIHSPESDESLPLDDGFIFDEFDEEDDDYEGDTFDDDENASPGESEQTAEQLEVAVPPVIADAFADGNKYRYYAFWGGRGSGKSASLATLAALRGVEIATKGDTATIVFAREFMVSLQDSSFEELKSAIRRTPYLMDFYEMGERFIRSKCGRVNFLFLGLRRNVDSLKGLSNVSLCVVDEAENVPESSWLKLIPSIRNEGSEIWIAWNPESKESAVHKRFRDKPPANAKVTKVNWSDNPFFPKTLDDERRNDLANRPEVYGHIWEGEFITHAEGAYYATEMNTLREDGRLGVVNYDPSMPVITSWDLGMSDSTSIAFWQQAQGSSEIRLIDYYEGDGVGLDHYARILQDKGYRYGEHVLPHDVRVRELGTGKSRLETLEALGIFPITIAPQLQVDDGIQAVRSMLANVWIDEERCERLIDCLRQYTREYNDKMKVWNSRPRHDWASHGADCVRYFAVGYTQRSGTWGEPIKRKLRGVA